MGHAIYTGSFTALETRWMEVVAEHQRTDPLREIDVLVGSNILAVYLKRRLAGAGRAFANIRFYTFLDLAERLAAISEYRPALPRLPRLGASIILEGILADPPAEYSQLSGLPGFRDALLDTLRDLRDAEITPEELKRVVDRDSKSKSRQYPPGLVDVYCRFRKQVGRFRDVDDVFRDAIRNAPAAKQAFGAHPLLVYGVYDCTGQQSKLLAALADVFEITFFIPYVDDAVSEFARPFLEARVRELGVGPIPLKETQPLRSLDRWAARGFGLTNLPRSLEGESLPADGSFALISVPGESRCGVEVVREIFRAVRDGTIAGFHEAAVILRQPENDIPILSETFRLRGIPYFVQGGCSFAESPLCKAVIALSNLESNSFSREAVLTAMELMEAALPESSALAWDVQSWRSLIGHGRFLSDLQCWDAGMEALVDEAHKNLQKAQESETDTAEEEDDERRAQSVSAAKKRLDAAISFRRGWQLLRQAAADWPANLPWEDWAGFLSERFEPLLSASEDWHVFLNVLDDISSLRILREIPIWESAETRGGAVLVSVERLRAALAQSISSLSYPAGRFQRSGVNLLSISAARGLRFPLVIIPGLDEGYFPARLREDPLLLDSVRRRMKNVPVKSERFKEEKLLFDMVARSAEKRLVLITSRLEESSDRERIPSQFFLSAATAIRGTVVSIRELTESNIPGFRSVSLDRPAPSEREVAVDEAEIRLRMITAEPDSARPALEALARMEPQRLKGPLAYDRARRIRKLTPYDGCLTDASLVQWAAQKLGASAGPVSASRLEEYAKCPYFFFLKRAVELEAWEEQSVIEGMDPLERGRLIHSILENFLRGYCGENFMTASEEELRRALETTAAEAFESARPAGIPDLLWEVERDALMTMIGNWLTFERKRAADGLLPFRLEQAFGEFGPGELYPAFRLRAGKHVFQFRGRIDRIDISSDRERARVVDYKTGTLPQSMGKDTRTPLMSGERIQLAVYKGALSALREFCEVKNVEGEYLHLQPKDGRVVPSFFDSDELERASRALPGILEILGDSVERGVFFARTSGAVRPSGHCEFCDYLKICGKDRVQREERKAGDPAVRRFLEILEPSP